MTKHAGLRQPRVIFCANINAGRGFYGLTSPRRGAIILIIIIYINAMTKPSKICFSFQRDAGRCEALRRIYPNTFPSSNTKGVSRVVTPGAPVKVRSMRPRSGKLRWYHGFDSSSEHNTLRGVFYSRGTGRQRNAYHRVS